MLTHNEIWRPVKGYEGLYEVSNYGRVKSLNYLNTKTEKILVSMPLKKGKKYLRVTLSKNGKAKTFQIHRLVAFAFPDAMRTAWFEGATEINHIDEDPSNNYVDPQNPENSNLEWCTHTYNINYGARKEKFSNAVRKPVGQYKNGVLIRIENSESDYAKYGYKIAHISACCRGVEKTYKGFEFRFL